MKPERTTVTEPAAALDGRAAPAAISSRRPSLWWVTATMLGGAFALLRWSGVHRGIWVDLDVYLAGAKSVLAGSDLYAIRVHDLPFTYPPFGAVAFVPLTVVPLDAARAVFTVGSIVCLVASSIVLARRLPGPTLRYLPVLLFALAFEPVVRTMLLGQVNAYLMALVVFDLFVVPRRFRGLLTGLAVGVKVTPAVFVLFLAVIGDWRAVARSALAFLMTVAISALVATGATWFYWPAGLLGLNRFGSPALIGGDNQSLLGSYLRIGSTVSYPAWLPLILLVMGVAFGLWAGHVLWRRGEPVAAVVAVAFGGLLGSPVSWTHHYLWAIPAVMVLQARGWRAAAIALGAVFVLAPMWGTVPGTLLELSMGPGAKVASVAYTAMAVLWVVLVVVVRSKSNEFQGRLSTSTPANR